MCSLWGKVEKIMAFVNINGSSVGTVLNELLMADDILPGASASYQLCKNIYLFHPIGAKLVDYPIEMAMSKQRIISVPDSPEDMVVNAFQEEWVNLKCDDHIMNVVRTSRIYGISSIIYGIYGYTADMEIPLEVIQNSTNIYFNVFDPLNTAGSLVLSQQPLEEEFQKPQTIAVNGVQFHPSRSCVVLNEEPIYLSFTSSAFGFVGRSVYQRALFPLKTFVQTMITDDLVTKKAGVLIAKIKAVGSFVDNIMQTMAGIKRNMLNESQTGNTISIDTDEDIQTLNMQNIDMAMTTPRKNVLENIALAAKMPAKILNAETFAEGFGEGTEDAKNVARFMQVTQRDMEPIYAWFDKLVMIRAWTPEFYKTVQSQFPEKYKKVRYNQAFMQWKNAFHAEFPNFLIEPDAEKIKTEDVRLKAVISLLEKLLPELDPENKCALIQFACDNFNDQKLLFKHPLMLDVVALQEFLEENIDRQQEQEDAASQGGGLGELGSSSKNDSQFVESDHPRAENGEFTSGSNNFSKTEGLNFELRDHLNAIKKSHGKKYALEFAEKIRDEDEFMHGNISEALINIGIVPPAEWSIKKKYPTKQFGSKSKIIDKNGRLMGLYHGTNADFEDFDLSKAGSGAWSNVSANGSGENSAIYLTNSKPHAQNYGKVKEFYVNMEKPLNINAENYLSEIRKSDFSNFKNNKELLDYYDHDVYKIINADNYFNDLIKKAKENGNDGVVVDFGKLSKGDNVPMGKVYLVFNDKNVINVSKMK